MLQPGVLFLWSNFGSHSFLPQLSKNTPVSPHFGPCHCRQAITGFKAFKGLWFEHAGFSIDFVVSELFCSSWLPSYQRGIIFKRMLLTQIHYHDLVVIVYVPFLTQTGNISVSPHNLSDSVSSGSCIKKKRLLEDSEVILMNITSIKLFSICYHRLSHHHNKIHDLW